MRVPVRFRSALGALAAVAVLIESARRARSQAVSPAEEHAFRVCNDAPDRLHAPAWIVMQSGSLGAVAVATGALAARRRPCASAVAAAVGSAVWLGAKVVKRCVGRGRPTDHLADVVVRGQLQTGLGYPSGHAAVALTLAMIIPRSRGRVARAVALALAAVTGGARMYVGAHLPLDVAGGLAVGVLAGRGGALLVDRCPPEGRRA
jgi:membrane-associated phospholipid phosphatase